MLRKNLGNFGGCLRGKEQEDPKRFPSPVASNFRWMDGWMIVRVVGRNLVLKLLSKS